MTITIADWKESAGLAPDAWAHEREVDGYLQVYWPGDLAGQQGWWWAIGTRDGRFLAGAWALGSVRDRNMDIARAMLPYAKPAMAVA